MSPAFEPFTPASGVPRPSGRASDDPWGTGSQAWGAEPEWDRGWAQPSQARQQPSHAPPQRSHPPQQQWYPEQPYAQPQQQWYAEPEPQQPEPQQPAPRQWVPERRYAADSAYPPSSYPVPAAVPTEIPAQRRSRSRTVVIGLVVALLMVSGWQAFRVEGMIRNSAELASAVTTEQGRTQELEKQLATVFDPEGISSAVLPSVFRVRAGDFTGTAFAVGRAGDGRTNLFTNFHVVEETVKAGDREVSLERGDTRIEATVVKFDAGKDLALLRTKREIKGLAPAAGDVRPGQQVVVVGAPLGLDDSVTTGVISAYRPDDSDGPTIQFDAPINPGNSGGPVVNTSKQVVGIATAKARDAEGIGLAIPIRTACDTLGACGKP